MHGIIDKGGGISFTRPYFAKASGQREAGGRPRNGLCRVDEAHHVTLQDTDTVPEPFLPPSTSWIQDIRPSKFGV